MYLFARPDVFPAIIEVNRLWKSRGMNKFKSFGSTSVYELRDMSDCVGRIFEVRRGVPGNCRFHDLNMRKPLETAYEYLIWLSMAFLTSTYVSFVGECHAVSETVS